VAYATGDALLSESTQVLLAGAGIAQQSSGFHLERTKRDVASVLVAYGSALGLQIGEFYVVHTALSNGLEAHSASHYATWRAYGA
jgi:hypothetical protein